MRQKRQSEVERAPGEEAAEAPRPLSPQDGERARRHDHGSGELAGQAPNGPEPNDDDQDHGGGHHGSERGGRKEQIAAGLIGCAKPDEGP